MSERKVIGIDLGGTTAKIGILNPKGKIELHWELSTDISNDGKYIIPNIIQSINEKLKQKNLSHSDIIGIGMGTPGTVDRDKGTVIGAYNLNWRTLQPIRRQMEEGTGIPFYLDNDANIAALGEQWVGAGNKEKNVVFVTLGTGVGGGIISDGKLLHGAIDAAGEIGHITVEPNGHVCTCGKKGCLEQYASATGIVQLAKDTAINFSGQSNLYTHIQNSDEVDAKLIFDLAKEGDLLAEEVVDHFAFYLGLALGNITNILNPSTIILGGGVSKAGSYLIDKVEAHIQDFIFPTIRSVTKVKLAKLGNDAGMIGAATLVLSRR